MWWVRCSHLALSMRQQQSAPRWTFQILRIYLVVVTKGITSHSNARKSWTFDCAKLVLSKLYSRSIAYDFSLERNQSVKLVRLIGGPFKLPTIWVILPSITNTSRLYAFTSFVFTKHIAGHNNRNHGVLRARCIQSPPSTTPVKLGPEVVVPVHQNYTYMIRLVRGKTHLLWESDPLVSLQEVLLCMRAYLYHGPAAHMLTDCFPIFAMQFYALEEAFVFFPCPSSLSALRSISVKQQLIAAVKIAQINEGKIAGRGGGGRGGNVVE